jgi:hypothetical protein
MFRSSMIKYSKMKMKGTKQESNVCECLDVITIVTWQWLVHFVVGIKFHIQTFHSSVHLDQYGHCVIL